MIVVVFGLPGSGKSYFAERLAKKLDSRYVNSDRLRRKMFPTRSYSEREKAMVYSAMLDDMEKSIANKEKLVLDATFHSQASRKPFIDKAAEGIVFIEVQADEQIIKHRLQKTRQYSEADFEIYKLIKGAWEPLEVPHLILKSTNDNIDSMLQQAIAHIKNDKGANR